MILAWSSIFMQVAVSYCSWLFLQKSCHYTGILGVNLFPENPRWTFLSETSYLAHPQTWCSSEKEVWGWGSPPYTKYITRSCSLSFQERWQFCCLWYQWGTLIGLQKQIALACCYVLWRFSVSLICCYWVNPIAVLGSNFHTAAYKMIFKTIILMSLT